MTPAQLEEALAGGDEYGARDAVRAVAEILRRPMHDDEDRIGLALALSEAASVHASARVREEIAKACDAFPDPFFDATLTLLAADADPYVREHARRAADRHATKKKERHKRDAQQRELDVALGALTAIDDADGHVEPRAPAPDLRRLAERAVRRGVENFMAQLDHELGKVHESIFASLGRLEVETDRDAPSPAALRRDVGDLQNRVAYLFSMLRRSRAYSQRITPRFERTDVAALVGEARAQLEARVRDRASFAFEADVEPGLVMDVDRHAMLQALQNLFQNAVEAYGDSAESAPARTVRVVARGRRAGSEVVLEVIDRGKGMSDGARACAFTPFKSDKPGGSGLGLMVARTMIEEVHDGALTFESQRGEGTCMTVVVPARRAGARGAKGATAAKENEKGKGAKR